MNIEELKQEVDVAMNDAVELGEGNASTASAYYMEAIAKMLYFRLFNENYEYDNPSLDYEKEIGSEGVEEDETS